MTNREAELFYEQAMAFLGQGKTQKALEFFDKALDFDETYVPIWNNKGVALLELEQYQEALNCFEQVIRLDAMDNMAWYNKGYVLLILEKYPESVETFNIFLERYSNEDDFYKFALYLQAKGLCALKKYEEALELIEKVIMQDKTFKEAQELLISVSTEIKKD
ncbi:MAG: tetratricopeptide repeat protein [Euryarchaeota archaeon]|nr:tetratricopeptide repeat protein [Euryarchaeota archaeon]